MNQLVDNLTSEHRLARLPIKVIMPDQGRERRVPAGGSKPKPFCEVDDIYRQSMVTRVNAIHKALEPSLRKTKLAPVRVNLVPEAIAKSHRPERLFSHDTCPIIGAGSLGELYVKATNEGLQALVSKIVTDRSPQLEKELSCIKQIEAVTPVSRRHGKLPEDILKRSPRKNDGFLTRVRLFEFGNDKHNQRITLEFEELCSKLDFNVNTRGYSEKNRTFAVECRTVADISALSELVGVRSIVPMPLVRIDRPRSSQDDAPPHLPSRDDVEGDAPVVVVVDSGISEHHATLQGWVVGRRSDVAPAYRNSVHGTFVAGLICWGHQLNPTLPSIAEVPCALFDLQVLPNSDPNHGDTGTLFENELLATLETALQNNANEYKVWNLSLSSDEICSLDEFSNLAQEFDNLQEKYQVSFVISAGNYSTPPLLNYPRTLQQNDSGRITAPADSVLGITVGAISQINLEPNGPKKHQPAAFSRHGPGPNYIIKPDLIHYGGSCSIDLSEIRGIRSVGRSGLSEDLGTSFSTPLVSRMLAQVYHQITPTPTPVLARALLTHHALDPRTGERVPDGEENYFGFGLPATPPYCLECSPHLATLIFDDTLRSGHYLEWDHFPYPPSLTRNGKYFGEIWMTIAFAPARGERWGAEYCETHISAHMGVYRDQVNQKTHEVKEVFKGLVPPEHHNRGMLYETFQVEQLRKWAPVRTYHRKLKETGERGNRWRLKLQLLTRHGIEKDSSTL